MSKFKVGDRVKKLDGKPFSSGDYVHTVDSIEGDKIWFVESKTWLSSGLQLAFGHPEDTSKYHKHHDLIIQWAKGAEIEFYSETFYGWLATDTPYWNPDSKYRIAPPTPQTDAERIAELEARVKELEDNQ
jgi:hypothetical protein